MNFDQIPSAAEGPALFIAYHGRPCFDIPFFIAQVFLRKKRLIHCVALRDNFKFPGPKIYFLKIIFSSRANKVFCGESWAINYHPGLACNLSP